MPQLQTLIHQIEEGGGMRFFKYGLLTLVLLGLLATYNLREFKNMANPEAMDTAQLGRNLAEGKGYKTLFVRPLSMYLLAQAYDKQHGPPPLGDRTDRSLVKAMHPDISNPPAYPFLLACLMKLSGGVRHQEAATATLNIGARHLNPWNSAGGFWIYPPDFWIGLFNQFIFLATVVLVFYFAKWLFDTRVAWTSAALFIGTDLFWRFSMSGLSTMMVMFVFVLLTIGLGLLEKKTREDQLSRGHQLLITTAIGLIVGLGCLTRYSFGWLILPVVLFIALFLGQHRIILCVVAFAAFTLVVSPWIARNYHLSRTFFGTAGYSVYETTPFFPEYRLERSLNPDLSVVPYQHVWGKLVANVRVILQEDLLKLGGNWLGAFFLVGLFISFHHATISRLRYFLLFCLPLLIVVQALGQTQLSAESPIINSENLLVLISPLVIIFGVSLFFVLLDQLKLPVPQLRYVVIGGFCACICLPAILNLALPRANAVAYPPYYPPLIQKVSAWMKPDELIMSDIPWAVAWYGERQSIWLTLDAQTDFFDVYDYRKPIKAIYLTPVTMDGRFLTQLIRAGEHSWGSFALGGMLKKELPPFFPLKHSPVGLPTDQLFLTDSDRWAGVPGVP